MPSKNPIFFFLEQPPVHTCHSDYDPKFSVRHVSANNVGPDQTAPRGAVSTLFAIPPVLF